MLQCRLITLIKLQPLPTLMSIRGQLSTSRLIVGVRTAVEVRLMEATCKPFVGPLSNLLRLVSLVLTLLKRGVTALTKCLLVLAGEMSWASWASNRMFNWSLSP